MYGIIFFQINPVGNPDLAIVPRFENLVDLPITLWVDPLIPG